MYKVKTLKISMRDDTGKEPRPYTMDVPVVKEFEYKGIKLFIHRDTNYRNEVIPARSFAVSEVTTGLNVSGHRFGTINGAIEEAQIRIDNDGVDKINELIEFWKSKNSIAKEVEDSNVTK